MILSKRLPTGSHHQQYRYSQIHESKEAEQLVPEEKVQKVKKRKELTQLMTRNNLASLFHIMKLRQYMRRWRSYAKEETTNLINSTSEYLVQKSMVHGVMSLLRAKRRYIMSRCRRSFKKWARYSEVRNRQDANKGIRFDKRAEDALVLAKYDVPTYYSGCHGTEDHRLQQKPSIGHI